MTLASQARAYSWEGPSSRFQEDAGGTGRALSFSFQSELCLWASQTQPGSPFWPGSISIPNKSHL